MAKPISFATKRKKSNRIFWLILLTILLGLNLWQFYKSRSQSSPPAEAGGSAVRDFYRDVQAKWGKGFMDLPSEELVIISPHNDRIRSRFEQAFVKQVALEKGKRVLIWWQKAEGSNAILNTLLGDGQAGQRPPMDVVFGGGVYLFEALAKANRLWAMTFSQEIREAIPADLGGVALIDPEGFWCGNVLSGFGFLVNKPLLAAAGGEDLASWQDLGRPELFDHIAVADPAVSGSAVMAFEMILQSAADWPSGWRDLLSILSNARQIAGSSDEAADGPLLGRIAVAICVDFYGTSRAALKPDTLVYVSPHGQTAFTPDPIGILQDAPHPEMARAFVEFVLSKEGQTLWGPDENCLETAAMNSPFRNPIRRDFYERPAGQLPAGMIDPYKQGASLPFDPRLCDARYGVLVELVKAAAVEPFSAMKAARAKLIQSGFDSPPASDFYRLPDNLDTVEEIYGVSRAFEDPARKEQIVSEWKRFFADQYRKVIQ
jgi:ABC-type Fe3+ transport system substrate-binding protein